MLGEVGDERAVDPLIQVLQDESVEDEIRTVAASSLGDIGDERAVDILIQVLQNPNDREIENAAIIGLGKVGGAGVVDLLVDALRDRSLLRESASKALQLIGPPAVEHISDRLLSEEYVWIHENLIRLLGLIGDKQALPSLKQFVKDKESDFDNLSVQQFVELNRAKDVILQLEKKV